MSKKPILTEEELLELSDKHHSYPGNGLPTREFIQLFDQAKAAIQLEARVKVLEATLYLEGERNTGLECALGALHRQCKEQGVEICEDQVKPVVDHIKAERQNLVEENERLRNAISDFVQEHDDLTSCTSCWGFSEYEEKYAELKVLVADNK